MNVSTGINLHGVIAIRATSNYSPGAPLNLRLEGANGAASTVSIFTYDQEWTNRLVAAINAVPGPEPIPEPEPEEIWRPEE